MNIPQFVLIVLVSPLVFNILSKKERTDYII